MARSFQQIADLLTIPGLGPKRVQTLHDELGIRTIGAFALRAVPPQTDGADPAHDASGFAQLSEGVLEARRGWIEKRDVLNTLPLSRLRKRLDAAMGR